MRGARINGRCGCVFLGAALSACAPVSEGILRPLLDRAPAAALFSAIMVTLAEIVALAGLIALGVLGHARRKR